MTAIDTFTPLESLLLVQSLATHGTQPDAFTTISASLKESEFLRDNPHFDEQKLNEDSLKSRYLRLLKDEAKQHLRTAGEREEGAVDGNGAKDTEQHPRSPHSPTIEDAESFAFLIPQLVVNLWEAYKNTVAGQIKEDERRFDELVADVKAVQLQEQEEIARKLENDNNSLQEAPSDRTSEQVADRVEVVPEEAGGTEQEINLKDGEDDDLAPPNPSLAVDETRPPHKTAAADAKISSILNPVVLDASPPSASKLVPDVIPVAPAREPTPHPQLAPATQRRIPPILAPALTPRIQPSQPGVPVYHQSPYEPIQARPNLAPSPIQSLPAQNAYPPVLPVPAGMSAPLIAWAPPQNTPEKTQRTPSLPATAHQLPAPDQKRRQSLPYTDPQRSQAEQWQTPQPYSARQAPQQPLQYQQQTPYSSQPPRGGGVMLPPFQVSPQNANASNQRTLPPPSTGTAPTKAHHRQTGTPNQVQSASQPRIPRGSGIPRTPVSSASPMPMAVISQLLRRRSGVTFSPGSSTGWRIIPSTQPIEEVERPMWSPVSEDEDKMDRIGAASAEGRKIAIPNKRSAKDIEKDKPREEPTIQVQHPEEQGAPKRGKGTRGGSKTPSMSTAMSRGRTRSQSVASHADESAVSSGPKKRKIKNEPSTPALQVDDTAPESKPQPTAKGRRRREKIPLTSAPPAVATSNKRKRIEVEPDVEDMDELTTPRPFHQSLTQNTPLEENQPLHPQQDQTPTITAFRNFQKMTVPIMNNITSHKHASIFANPVKERDAEGYTDIIRRPQDLKSIRSAIVAGSRTVAALTASDSVGTPGGTPRATGGSATPSAGGSGSGSGGGGSATVTLPWSTDLVPPRAIVNGAQLEQEVMRMFANAVMYNAGDEGVVRDTREMFESVEASIAAWRAAERNAAESRSTAGAGGVGTLAGPKVEEEMDELGEGDEGIVLPAAKRRRG